MLCAFTESLPDGLGRGGELARGDDAAVVKHLDIGCVVECLQCHVSPSVTHRSPALVHEHPPSREMYVCSCAADTSIGSDVPTYLHVSIMVCYVVSESDPLATMTPTALMLVVGMGMPAVCSA